MTNNIDNQKDNLTNNLGKMNNNTQVIKYKESFLLRSKELFKGKDKMKTQIHLK